MSTPENLLLKEPRTPFNIPAYLIHIREIMKRKKSTYLETLFQRHLSMWACWLYDRQQYNCALAFWQEAALKVKEGRERWLCQIGCVKCLCKLEKYSDALSTLSSLLNSTKHPTTIKNSPSYSIFSDEDTFRMKLFQCQIYKKMNKPLPLHETFIEIETLTSFIHSESYKPIIASINVYISEQITIMKSEAENRIQKKDWEAAKYYLENCLKMDPLLETCWVMLGDVLIESKDKQYAKKCFETAIKLFLASEDAQDRLYLSRLEAKKRLCTISNF